VRRCEKFIIQKTFEKEKEKADSSTDICFLLSFGVCRIFRFCRRRFMMECFESDFCFFLWGCHRFCYEEKCRMKLELEMFASIHGCDAEI
jgi:hypothetical protein